MILQTYSLTPDGQPDDESIAVMKAALRDLKVSLRHTRVPLEHPRRAEMLDILADARLKIERING